MNELKLKKHSAIIQMSNINTEARKAYNYFLYKAREKLLKEPDTDNDFKVDITSVKRATGAKNNKALKNSIRNLMYTTVEYNTLNKDKKTVWGGFTLLPEVEIENGIISYYLPKKVFDTIVEPSVYCIIDLEIIKGLTSKYSIALYEFLEDYQNIRKKNINLDDFKKFMGLAPDTYQNTNDLRRRVIDKAIAEIEAKTPFRVSYTMKKFGRAVNAIEFSFINKNQAILDEKYMEKTKSFEKFRNFLKEEAEEFDIFTYKNKIVSYALHPQKGRHLLYYKNGDGKDWMSDREALTVWKVLMQNKISIRDKILEEHENIWY